MKLNRVARALGVAAVLLVVSAASGEPPRPRKLETVGTLRGPLLAQKLNQQHTFEGFYYDGSIPMIVDDIARVRANVILPEHAYVPITGAVPAGVKSGDHVRLTATLEKPVATHLHLQRESAVARLASPAAMQVVKASVSALGGIVKLNPGVIGRIDATKYAVLLAGGANAANNHMRYWNDLVRTYNLLRNKGYAAANIKVVYADGVAKSNDMPVDYSASFANLQTVFTGLGQKMTSFDSLYVMVTDHGGGFLAQASGGYGPGIYGGALDTDHDEDGPVQEATYNQDLNGNGTKTDTVTFDETINLWGATMTDDAFKGLVNSIPNYGKMMIQFNECFSGGFLRDLAGPRRVLMSAASKTQFSWSEPNGTYEELLKHYLTALEGGDATADTNHDGKVSLLEAYEYARTKDVQPETPFYDDDGIYPPHSGAMPGGGEGAIGAAWFL